MQVLRESVQYGTSTPKVSLIFVLSSTEYAGRFTGDGNSSEWHGNISHLFCPENSCTIFAKSYHEHTPSFEK